MGRLIGLGDMDAGLTILANYALDQENAELTKHVFMSEDDKLSIYEYLRQGLDDPSITKESLEAAAREKTAGKSNSKSALDELMAKANEPEDSDSGEHDRQDGLGE